MFGIRKYVGLVVGAGLLAEPMAAEAGSITYSTSVGPADLDWTSGVDSQTVQLQQFDPSVFGAMPSGMTLSFTGQMLVISNSVDGGGIELINRSSASSNAVTLDGTWTFTVSASGLDPDFNFNMSSQLGPKSVGRGNVTPYVATFAGVGSTFAFTGGPTAYMPVPTSFIGAGLTSLDVSDIMDIENFTGLNSSRTTVVWDLAAQGTLSVTYDVPAPGALALLGLGLIGLGVTRRRKFQQI